MTNSVYQELRGMWQIGGDLKERIKSLSLWHIFGPIEQVCPEAVDFNSVFFYVLEVYSIQSHSLILECDWMLFKENQYERFQIKEDLKPHVLLLGEPRIRDVCRDYIDYQKAPVWRHYCMLQDLYGQMLSMALSLTAGVEEKHKAAKYARSINDEISEYRERLRQEYRLLEKAEKELPQPKKLQSLSLNIEDYVRKEISQPEESDLSGF